MKMNTIELLHMLAQVTLAHEFDEVST